MEKKVKEIESQLEKKEREERRKKYQNKKSGNAGNAERDCIEGDERNRSASKDRRSQGNEKEWAF